MAARKTTLGSTLTALQKAEAHVQRLRHKAASQRREPLRTLHSSFGFASRRELIDALMALDGGRSDSQTAEAAPAPARTGKRARLTPAMKTDIAKAIKSGQSGNAVAKLFGVSVQTVQNIKKAAGLVRARKKSSRK